MPDRQSLPRPVGLYLDITTALVKLPFRVAFLPVRVVSRGLHAAPLVKAGIGAVAGGLRRGSEDLPTGQGGAATADAAGSETPADETRADETRADETPADETPVDEQPKGAPTPTQREAIEARARADAPHLQSVPSPASPSTVEEVVNPLNVAEEVLQASQAEPGSEMAHGELPLPDYDHLTLGSLRSRLRSLDALQLVQLRDYERAHASRLPVLMLFDNRIAKLSAGESEPPPLAGQGGTPGLRS
ncbi:MAG: hypothetical protein M3Z02_00225 [Actinomycetota bacterium]|nr:hypothetical protein [Actinomycetota bacterium]